MNLQIFNFGICRISYTHILYKSHTRRHIYRGAFVLFGYLLILLVNNLDSRVEKMGCVEA